MNNEEMLLRNPHSTDGINNLQHYIILYLEGVLMIKHMNIAFDKKAKKIKDDSKMTWQQILDLGLEVVERGLQKKSEEKA